jgi:hypothetical protein
VPGQQRSRRRAPPQPQPGSAREILSDIFGSVFDFVGERVVEAAPRCELCGEIAVPLRCACGRFGCRTHGYFNFSLGRAICPDCARGVGAPVMSPDEVEDDEKDEEPQRPPPRQRKRPRSQQQARAKRGVPEPSPEAVSIAWEILGLDSETATEADINRALRKAARECHPDLHPGDAAAARKFRALRQATELCLGDLEARGKR